ncbi:MAG TPA: enoyl-CoA hydratase family protein [Rhizomicrobium sp.]|jgi:enoyl-CoA hydratase/carnithine racemase|nr:enoyl-CoA hydratase family protein [Rhizomicrobium sp.]
MTALSAWKPDHVRLAVKDGVALVTLSRPEKKNPLTFESYAELVRLFRDAATDDDVKAFVLTGDGGNFCSGGDVFEIIGPLVEKDAKGLLAFTRMTGDLVKAMRACPQPVVAAVDGVCAGAGAIMAMASDLRIGTATAKVAFLFNRVGLAGCDMGACAMLPRIIGLGRASELLFLGRSMSGDEGLAWGFFNRLAASGELQNAAMAIAAEIASGPSFAHALTKKMLATEWAMALEAAIDAEAIAQALCMQTADFKRAYQAFAAREKPKFQGN